jgi:hypothetical protein
MAAAAIRKEYFTCVHDYELKDISTLDDYDKVAYANRNKFQLPDWFINADKSFRKVVKVLGASAGWYDKDTGEQIDVPKGTRLAGNLAKDCPRDGFLLPDLPDFNYIMMVNNYNCVKEYDITESNIRVLEWEIRNKDGNAVWYPHEPGEGDHNLILDLVVELQIELTL